MGRKRIERGQPHRGPKTHTLRAFRSEVRWSRGETVQLTSCGMAVHDRLPPGKGYADYSFQDRIDNPMLDYSFKYLHYKLPDNIWLVQGWDHLEIEIVKTDPTCGNCKRTRSLTRNDICPGF